jgi:hypothetical protein
MSNDSSLFRSRSDLAAEGYELEGNSFARGGDCMLPLYEAKMVNHFDHRYGDYGLAVLSDGKAVRELPHVPDSRLADAAYVPLPNQWVAESEVTEKLRGRWQEKWLLGWRGITNATNERTVIAGVIPKAGVGNSFPIALVGTSASLVACLTANLSSFVLDFVARCKIGGTNLNFFILEQLPILGPSAFSEAARWAGRDTLETWIRDRVLELTYTAWDLAPYAKALGYEGLPFMWDARRREGLRAELDAAFFHLYGIDRDDVAYIMDTFWVVHDRDERAHGEYRTKRLILERYDALAAVDSAGVPYESPLDPPPGDSRAAHRAQQATAAF